VGWGHGCLTDSVTLAADAKVSQLALFHHDPSHRDYQIDVMVEAARRLPTAGNLKIYAAAEMDTVSLPLQRIDTRRMPNENAARSALAFQEANPLLNPQSLPQSA
jgi:hypothetical protein